MAVADFTSKSSEQTMNQVPVAGQTPFEAGTGILGYDKALADQKAAADAAAVTGTTGVAGVKKEVSNLMAGLATPLTAEELKKIEDQKKTREDAVRSEAESLFGADIMAAERLKNTNVSGAQAQVGVNRGLGLSSSAQSYLAMIEGQADAKINELKQKQKDYIASGNYKAWEAAQSAQDRLEEQKQSIALKKIDAALKFYEMDRDEKTQDADIKYKKAMVDIDLAKVLTNVPVGKKITVGGVDYEGLDPVSVDDTFKGSDFVAMMKEIPAGETKEVTDPITKKVYTVKGLSSTDPTIKTVEQVDDKGYVTLLTYKTDAQGKTTLVSSTKSNMPVGKTKSETRVTVNTPTYGSSPNNVYSNGQFIGTQRYDSKSGTVIKQDINGNIVNEWPAGSTLDKPKEDDDTAEIKKALGIGEGNK